jgi:hypothetical protein
MKNKCPSPDGSGISRFRKTRLFAVVFVNREYNGQQEIAPKIITIWLL